MASRTIKIPAQGVETLKREIARLNRLAERHGLAGRLELLSVGLVYEARREVTLREAGERGTSSIEVVQVRDAEVQVPDIPLSRGGWVLGGLAEATDSGLDVTVLDERARPFVQRVKEGTFECEHCHARRARSRVIVALEQSTSSILLLGTECAKAYISEIDSDLRSVQFKEQVEIVIPEDDGWFDRGERGYARLRAWPLSAALEVAVHASNKGYVPRWTQTPSGDNVLNPNSTRELAFSLLREPELLERPDFSISDSEKQEALQVAEWIGKLNPSDIDDALRSAYDCHAIDLVSERKLGAICWAIEARRRDIAAAAKQAAILAAGADKNEAPSDRQTIEGVVLSSKIYENDYGTTTKLLVEVTVPERHAFTKVFLTQPAGLNAKRGDTIKVKATFVRNPEDPKFSTGSRPRLIAP